MAIALINRTLGPITAAQIQDVKPYPLPLGPREHSFAPLLFTGTTAGTTYGGFTFETGLMPYKIMARKPGAQLTAFGTMQIVLPGGVGIAHIRLRGIDASAPRWQFTRCRHDGSAQATLVSDSMFVGGAFDRLMPVSPAEPPVDNSLNYYALTVYTSGSPQVTDIYGGSVRFAP